MTKILWGDETTGRVFPLFVALYVTGFMMEMVEYWRFPGWTAVSVVLSLATIALAGRRIVFLVFLILTTAYFLLVRFPEVANHVNLLIFCNILLLLGMAYSYVSPLGRRDFPAYFEALLSPARLMLIVTYTMAGFHKLNSDFLNPEVSCIRDFLATFRLTLTRPIFEEPSIAAVPLLAILAAIGVPVGLIYLRSRLGRVPIWLLLGGLVVLAAAALLILSRPFSEIVDPLSDDQTALIVLGVAAIIVFWQLVEGPLLLIPRFQAFFLFFALLFHTYLGMIGFVDFQSLAMALLLAFVPKEVLDSWFERRAVTLGGLSVERVHIYVGLNLLAGILSGIHFHLLPLFEPLNIRGMQGLFFNGGVLILIWPLLAALLSPRTRSWRWLGVPVFDGRTPKFLFLLPAFLLFFGMTSHLGLRTAGNFSMFSNLRTEGAMSNHLIFKNNPIKIWDYQEDVVRVIELDDDAAAVGLHYTPNPLTGLELPVVEFRKVVSTWARAGKVIPIVFEYDGERYASDNIAADPEWLPSHWDWEMILLDFRVIQRGGANECRW